jgi:hypothetical protein
MDGVSAIFFAAAMGAGVLVTSAIVLVFQGLLTLLARPLRRLAQDTDMMREMGAAGGVLQLGIALGLLDLKDVAVANYLPALIIAPALVVLSRKFGRQPDAPQTPGLPD